MSNHNNNDDSKKGAKGLTRRELFKGIGGGALAGSLLPATGFLQSIARADTGHGAAIVGPGAVQFALTINGVKRSVEVEPRLTLLSLLRDRLDLTGAKLVCDRGACGACTVHLDGLPVMACMILAIDCQGRAVNTIEGLEKGGALSPLQQAFVDHDALQCGFCTPGMVMSCAALLSQKAHPNLEDVKRAVAGNLCRCGTYPKVFEATLAAAKAGIGKAG